MALGASGSPALAEEVTAASAKEMRAAGINWAYVGFDACTYMRISSADRVIGIVQSQMSILIREILSLVCCNAIYEPFYH